VPREWIVLAAGLPLLLAGLHMVQRGERTPSSYWIGGWIAASLGGLISLLAAGRPALRLLSFPLGTLFAWFLLGGAILLSGRRVPAWLLPLGLALGALRSVLAGLGFTPAAYFSGFVLDLPAVLAAGLFARRAIPSEAASLTQRLLPWSFVPLALAGCLYLVWRANGQPLEWTLTLWMLVTPPLLALQLRVGAEWTRRHLVLARRDLERTIAERTAELALANESLRRSEERYRTVSELSSDLSFGFRISRDGRVEGEWVTEAFGRMTGFEAHEMVGDRWLALIHPDDRESAERSFRAAIETGKGAVVLRIVGKHGGVRWLEARVRIERDADCIRIVGAARDVTDARHSDEERFRLERQVQETQRLESLGLVTGGVAHDFNNLLTVILGNGRLALAELPPLHPLRPRLERMLAAAEHGAGLTEQMLVYAGRAPRAQKPVELSSLVAGMLDLARASLPRRVTLHEALGAPVWVLGDETQLRQVVLNLVANAGEAIGARGGSVQLRTALVEVAAEEFARARGASLEPGPLALLEVVDDGAGMDETTCERVFEPFFTTRLSGRGLGLAAVLGIVRGHCGKVGVLSAPGGGSSFRVWLPAALQLGRDAPAPEPAATRWGGSAARVLVIDDQEPVLELARELLGRAGYDVQTALGGRAGLERFVAAPAAFDVVVLDLAMPDLDGGLVGKEVRSLRAELPLLLVSGYDVDLAAVRLASLQPARFLRKPYEREGLVGALEQLLVGAGARAKRPEGR
jgi:PAS domain S-box-containing protein